MKDRAHENLIELLQRFMDEPAAREAEADIRVGEQWLNTYPAPAPRRPVITAIHTQMVLSARRRHRIVRLVHGSLAAAAALVILALIGPLGPRSASRSPSSMAFIPTAVWESDDITTADLDLAYFSSEIRQIEAQMMALEAGDNEAADASEEIEMELMAIQAEVWKG